MVSIFFGVFLDLNCTAIRSLLRCALRCIFLSLLVKNSCYKDIKFEYCWRRGELCSPETKKGEHSLVMVGRKIIRFFFDYYLHEWVTNFTSLRQLTERVRKALRAKARGILCLEIFRV